MEQQDLFAAYTQQQMEEFLTSWLAIEEEHDRLREQQRALRDEYAEWFSVRALTTAVKVVRAKAKLAEHPKEPTALVHQGAYEHVVRQCLERRAAEREALTAETERLAQRRQDPAPGPRTSSTPT